MPTMRLRRCRLLFCLSCFALICRLLYADNKSELFTVGGPFKLKIYEVRSLPVKKVGFSESSPLYRVDAGGFHRTFVLYCLGTSPQTGATYTALDEYVGPWLSALHLWPVDRRSINLPARLQEEGKAVSDGRHSGCSRRAGTRHRV